MILKRQHLLIAVCWATALTAFFCGCRSSSSTFLRRHDNDQFTADSNGSLGLHDDAKPFRGIPVTLKVPTHLDIEIQEIVLLTDSLDPIPLAHRHLEAVPKPVFSDKIFAVDPKRVAAGTTNYTLDMNDAASDERQRQYFKQIKHKLADETLQDLNNALNDVLPLLTKRSAGTPTAKDSIRNPGSDGEPMQLRRVVAFKRFDIHDPHFEADVECFLDQHLNACNSCSCNTTPAAGAAFEVTAAHSPGQIPAGEQITPSATDNPR